MTKRGCDDGAEPATKRTSDELPRGPGWERRLVERLRTDRTSRLSALAPDMLAAMLLPLLGDARLHAPRHTVDGVPSVLHVGSGIGPDARLGDLVRHMSATTQQIADAHALASIETPKEAYSVLGEWPPGQVLLGCPWGVHGRVCRVNAVGVTWQRLHHSGAGADYPASAHMTIDRNNCIRTLHRIYHAPLLSPTLCRWRIGGLSSRITFAGEIMVLGLCCRALAGSHREHYHICDMAQRSDGKFVILAACHGHLAEDGQHKDHVDIYLVDERTSISGYTVLAKRKLGIYLDPAHEEHTIADDDAIVEDDDVATIDVSGRTMQLARMCLDGEGNIIITICLRGHYAVPAIGRRGDDILVVRVQERTWHCTSHFINRAELATIPAGLQPDGGDQPRVVAANTVQLCDGVTVCYEPPALPAV
jgi:hypothetical protein